MLESDLLVVSSWEGSKQLQAKTGLEMSVLDCSLILEKLREYNAFPILLGTEEANENWYNPDMVKCINVVFALPFPFCTFSPISCAVLGAAFAAAQKDRYTNKWVEGKKDWMSAGFGENFAGPVKWEERMQALGENVFY